MRKKFHRWTSGYEADWLEHVVIGHKQVRGQVKLMFSSLDFKAPIEKQYSIATILVKIKVFLTIYNFIWSKITNSSFVKI